jgi:23S rRNA pseudouridine2605 synthase
MDNRRPPPRPGNNAPRRGPNSGGPARRPQSQRPATPAPPRADRTRTRAGASAIDGPDRLQKVLAHAGVGSRRACEELIVQGRVTIDGKVARELGTKVDPRSQKVAVDGQRIHAERNVYYAVHKPKGYVSTNNDPAGKPLVINLLPEIPQRAYAVGRLDEQSTGLMLLTNDGELANKLAHPKFGVEKIYRVVVAGEPGREILDQLTKGIWLAEGKVRAKRVKLVGRKGHASIMEMVLAEGKNREIRRMLAKLGHKVMSLTRIAVGPIGLKGLGVGECRPLTAREIDLLRQVASGQNVPGPSFPDRRPRTPRPTGPQGRARPPVDAGAGQGAEGPRDRVAPRPPAPSAHGGRPRPEGRRDSGPPPRPNTTGPGQPPRYATGQGHRPAQNRPRPAQGQGQGRDQGPAGGPPRPPARRPGPHSPSAGPPPVRSKAPAPARPEAPTRRIIGLDSESSSGRGGPPGPRMRRPLPKRAPRAAQGMKRLPKRDETGED